MIRQLQLEGWGIERTVLTKIELQHRCLTGYELIVIARVSGVGFDELLPPKVGSLRDFFGS